MALGRQTVATALVLVAFSIAGAIRLANSAQDFNTEMALADVPLSTMAPIVDDPKTPRLARRVVLVIVDGLRVDHSKLPFFDALRARGASVVASAPYPTISRPSYGTILTGAPPVAHGVRTNRLPWSIALDSIMDRAQAGKLRVGSATDIGLLATLFVRGQETKTRSVPATNLDYRQTNDVVKPPIGLHWPFEDVRRASSIEQLGRSTGQLIDSHYELVLILAGDVDRAGHAYGVGEEYANAAAIIDRTLGDVLAKLELERDAVIITSDHGHVDRGGHGGEEPEVVEVPLILAGAGIARGATSTDATLLDLAPTISALLGLPAPGHAFGRTLVELLQLDREAADRRLASDRQRRTAIDAAIPPPPSRPSPLRLVLAFAGAAVAILLARTLVAVRVFKHSLAGGLAFAIVMGALFVITRGSLSPSAVPALYRFEKLVAISAIAAIVVQLAAYLWLSRRVAKPDRLVAANGFAIAGLTASLLPVALMRAWFSPPHVDVPSAEWLVGIPGIELAGAVGCAAIAVALVVELIRAAVARGRHRHGRPASIPVQPAGRDR